MTEAEWLACTDPRPMLEILQDRASVQKLRLFACACCRRVAPLLSKPDFIRALEVAERYVDGQAREEECRAACKVVEDYYNSATPENDYRNSADLAVVWATSVRLSAGFAHHAAD